MNLMAIGMQLQVKIAYLTGNDLHQNRKEGGRRGGKYVFVRYASDAVEIYKE